MNIQLNLSILYLGIKRNLMPRIILQLLMHSVYMNIVRVHAFKASPTLLTVIYLRLDMFALHVFIDVTLEPAGVATVYTVPLSILSLHLTLYFKIYKNP